MEPKRLNPARNCCAGICCPGRPGTAAIAIGASPPLGLTSVPTRSKKPLMISLVCVQASEGGNRARPIICRYRLICRLQSVLQSRLYCETQHPTHPMDTTDVYLSQPAH